MTMSARLPRGRAVLPAAFLLAGVLAAAPAPACTSFCLDTPAGPVYATNLDLFEATDGLVLINRRGIAKTNIRANPDGTTTAWTSKYASVTFNIAGRGLPWSGMNEAGLVLSPMQLMAAEYPKPDDRPPFDIATWTQYALDTCTDVADVIDVARRLRLVDDSGEPNHLMAADAHGSCVALEYLDGKLVCRTGDDLPVKAMSNMRYERALVAYDRGGPRWWWSNPGASAQRFATAADRMKAFDAIRDSSATMYALATLTRFVAAPHTKWSIVYDIPNREVVYRTDESPDLKHLALRDFGLSCDAPLRMLPVNAPLAGNVGPDFVPYDAAANLRIFRDACRTFGIDVSEEAAVGLMDLIDGFECASPKR
jgi:Linear amide C-N hydrolases, choloylglycine hydrolase family